MIFLQEKSRKGMRGLRYYIADLHFFHEALNDRMDRRGFTDTEAMNAYMLERWNGKVRKNDEVIILGDLLWGRPEETGAFLKQLNGRLYLIQGNHDRFLTAENTGRFQWIRPYAELSDNRRKVVLCHYPILCYKGQYRLKEDGSPGTYMLHGHVHDTQDQRLLEQFQDIIRHTVIRDASGAKRQIPCNLINCFCMYSDYEPLTLDEWIECDRKRRQSSPPGLR